jgi:hypothetical protein
MEMMKKRREDNATREKKQGNGCKWKDEDESMKAEGI